METYMKNQFSEYIVMYTKALKPTNAIINFINTIDKFFEKFKYIISID